MPIFLDTPESASLELDDVLDQLKSQPSLDRDEILSRAGLLAGLSNNRRFLIELINSELKDAYKVQAENRYSSQVFFLGAGKDFFMRANFWPSQRDAAVRSSGPDAFFYGYPHDHNFDFLTVGYYGPGYGSNFYEYDHNSVAGYVGEPVDLRYVCTATLPQHSMMFYRKCIDIHEQLYPETFSISLNIVSNNARETRGVNQFLFDTKESRIRSLINRNSLPIICQAAAYMGDGETIDVMATIARKHIDARARYEAYRACAMLDPAGADQVWARAASDSSRFVSEQAEMAIRGMQEGVEIK
ncbi:hypothetical protein DWU98_06300 [Dyella monticola]|uniref:Uncharacterized protein n=1 Tax=Dyella monticola TaxID=1927958 RepID=A0A370X3A2_9GAMM|nr:HEAT repeat domain-containing protein [Dyella monticola]RDS82760.1 hypothetical protein DWU98_06300 [Dyella monticola]